MIQDPSGPEGLECLLAPAPDFLGGEDDLIVIARLRDSEFPSSSRESLSLSAVTEFMPLTARGMKILGGDARRAGVNLAEPIFEAAFEERRRALQRRHLHKQGERFVEAAGFQLPSLDTDRLAALTEMVLRKPKLFAKIERKRNRVYFGWAVALSNLSERVSPALWREIRREVGVETFMKALGERIAKRVPIATEADVRQFAQSVRLACSQIGVEDCWLIRDSVVGHWVDFLEVSHRSGLEDVATLTALGKDLRVIEADEGSDSAALAAYWIGRSARAETVSQLFYAQRAEHFPCLNVTAPRNWVGDPATKLEDLPQARLESDQLVREDSPSSAEAATMDTRESVPQIEVVPKPPMSEVSHDGDTPSDTAVSPAGANPPSALPSSRLPEDAQSPPGGGSASSNE